MCFSAEVSMVAFLIGFGSSVALWFMNTSPDYRIIAVFFAYISLMQLLEFFLWNNQKCDEINKNLSYIGLIITHLQPVILGLITILLSKAPNIPAIIGVLIIYSLCMIPYSLQFKDTEDLQCTHRIPGNPHLIWTWNDLPNAAYVYVVYLLAFILIPFLGFKSVKNATIFAITTVSSFQISSLFYKRAMGTMWCFFGAFVPVGYLVSLFIK
jgi:hypothetical protein